MPKDTAAENNYTLLSGEIVSPCRFSHEIYGEGFYTFDLASQRLSGNSDILPVTVSERIMEGQSLDIGRKVCVTGQIRSYNSYCDKRSRLVLTVFAKELDFQECEDTNQILLNGYICKAPVYRTTPFGREITDILLAVNRAYNKSDYIPCIFWGRNAKYTGNLKTGDNILVWGRVQSRQYQKKNEDGIEERTAYEVSVSRIEKKTEQ
ncbi:MAG TPA: single-stranded DNA-binding protein [Lachnospiraceae bacterium]|jgi:Single-stranded DNA-binding protein|nr:single-stranded DNA-binding protein [Lachnospiraceae bacterium]